MTEPRKEMVQAAMEIYVKGLVIGQVGNISVKENKKILISCDHCSLGRMSEEDMVTIDLSGEKIAGDREPSIERYMHAEIYQARSDITAVVHTHSPYASAFAYLKRSLKPVNPEARHILGRIPIVPYFTSGTKELAKATATHLGKQKVALLEKHGVISVGKYLEEAVNLAELVEEIAKINYLVVTLEKFRWLKLLDRVLLDKVRYLGKQP